MLSTDGGNCNTLLISSNGKGCELWLPGNSGKWSGLFLLRSNGLELLLHVCGRQRQNNWFGIHVVKIMALAGTWKM